MKILQGKNIIITGASRGIGKTIVQLFISHGANIAFTYHSSDKQAKDLEQEFSTTKSKVKAYRSDASDFDAAQQLISDVLKDFGSIDVLINNAGITKDTLLMRMSEEDFDSVMNVNMKSVFNFFETFLTNLSSTRSILFKIVIAFAYVLLPFMKSTSCSDSISSLITTRALVYP